MPDFIGIGAMRSGTSWLYRNLVKHPQIGLTQKKELHFFDQKILKKTIPFLPVEYEAKLRYSRYFLPSTLRNKVKGEFTPAYAILPVEKISLIQSWMPTLKLIFIMRDPVMRAWSHARKDFHQYSGKPLQQASTDELIEFFKIPAVADRGNYFACLENWFKFYQKDRFFIAFTDEITSRPLQLLNGVFQFLEVDQDFEIEQSEIESKVNSRPSLKLPSEIHDYLARTLYQQNDNLEDMIERKLPW